MGSVSELIHKAFQELANGKKNAVKFRTKHTKHTEIMEGNETKMYEYTIMGQFDDVLMRDISDIIAEGVTRTWKVYASKEWYQKKNMLINRDDEKECIGCMAVVPNTTCLHNNNNTHNFDWCRACLSQTFKIHGRCPDCNLNNVKSFLVQKKNEKVQKCYACEHDIAIDDLVYEIQNKNLDENSDNEERYCANCIEKN